MIYFYLLATVASGLAAGGGLLLTASERRPPSWLLSPVVGLLAFGVAGLVSAVTQGSAHPTSLPLAVGAMGAVLGAGLARLSRSPQTNQTVGSGRP